MPQETPYKERRYICKYWLVQYLDFKELQNVGSNPHIYVYVNTMYTNQALAKLLHN